MKKLALGLILLSGFILRTYNLDFPSIGYHNMKENESLSIAQEMAATGDYVNKRLYFQNAFEQDTAVKNYPQPPMVSYQILLAWKYLGENLWAPRLINVIFGLLGILVMYLIGMVLFRRALAALLCAFALAVMPLAVFFSRNLQPEVPGLFFMLLGSLFYLRFVSSSKKYNLLLGGIAFFIAWAYKFNYLIGIVPFFFCIPYKALWDDKKGLLKTAFAAIFPYLGVLAAVILLNKLGQWGTAWPDRNWLLGRLEIFKPGYWANSGGVILWYIRGENFTIVFSLLASFGIMLSMTRKNSLADRYIIGWIASAIIYAVLYADQLGANNFAQMPFLALVCVASVYAVSFFIEEVKRHTKKDTAVLFILLVIGISAGPVYASLFRMSNTVFPGQDVAGETLKEFTSPGERIFLFTYAQGYGIARYAHRYVGWPVSYNDFKDKEKRFGVRYLCIYPGDYLTYLQKQNPELYGYIENNYSIKEIGLSERLNKLDYVIMEKGKGQKINEFLNSFSGNIEPRTIYKLFGRFIFFYAVRPGEPPAKKT